MFITGFAAVALNPDNHAPKDAKILSKPFHLRDLVDQVERLLGRLRCSVARVAFRGLTDIEAVPSRIGRLAQR